MAGRSALNAEMQVSPAETLREQPLLWHPIFQILPCGVIGNISLFESVRVACQRHRLQVQDLTGQLGGKQSPGTKSPVTSHS
jgi:hypothetical protein